jgi:TetR/AcrR family transcriptional repressor of nem operon
MAKGNAKEKLTRSALQIMLSRGYTATTVDEICEGAGLSKGSFYHFFETKEDIGVAALELFHQEGFKQSIGGKYSEITDPIERVFGFLDHVETVAKDIWGDGCLLGNFALELADTNPIIRNRVSALLKKSTENLARIFEPIANIRKKGEGPSAVELAEHYISLIEGAIVLGKAHKDWRRIPTAIRQFRHYLECLAVR